MPIRLGMENDFGEFTITLLAILFIVILVIVLGYIAAAIGFQLQRQT